jgi:hypothetical protein
MPPFICHWYRITGCIVLLGEHKGKQHSKHSELASLGACCGFWNYNPSVTEGNGMRTLLLSILVLALCLTAQDDWHGDGNSLLKKCSLAIRVLDGETLSSADAVGGALCVGYVMGVHDIDSTVQMLEKHEKTSLMNHACVPSNVSTNQAVRTVVKYLRDNPAQLHRPASVLVIDAVRSSFPCT